MYDSILSEIQLPKGSLTHAFQIFYDSQVDDLSKVNMFDYIMKSHVFAFDYTQQQAVLNTYFGEMSTSSGNYHSPSNAEKCSKFREPRLNLDQEKNHCDPKAGKARTLFSRGR
jgi:hypothetical protein